MTEKVAFITGITGQDGSYMADFLLKKKYRVVGLTRQQMTTYSANIAHLEGQIDLVSCDYSIGSLSELIHLYKPNVIYNFTGQTYVGKSWGIVTETVDSIAVIPNNLLKAIAETDTSIRYFQAGSSEIFSNDTLPISECSVIAPSNPYGCAKAYAYFLMDAYRRHYNIFAVNGFLFNHESPRRGSDFLSKKVVREAVKIKLGLQNKLVVGNIQVARDFGYAPDYMQAVYLMMQSTDADDYVVATGKSYKVEDIIAYVFSLLDMDYQEYIEINPKLFRKNEVPIVYGDSKKLLDLFGWKPKKTLKMMLEEMVKVELEQYPVELRDDIL